jgi:hypothetical protein
LQQGSDRWCWLQRGLRFRVVLAAFVFNVVLLSVTPESGAQPQLMYYYLAQFPENPNDTKKVPPQFKQPRAYGFSLGTTAVCGTVNMDLVFEEKGQKIEHRMSHQN